ncbi:MAG TPA: HD-GYP domain-containing protein [Anaerohalosphaeraceae bacterium]|nr:HD-GYP domain-containing protein [Anaerohalosphaeraceae bacterium]HOL31732.1 HD-GYP domain-containing protein [Anaerohalosphaeraceae bacterium]HOM75460.1 HD-GYP domain-containing protein [Anaerohalosphaeraceae bacterium]HPC63812.1 HD-GYP domain-containing protein [Anaerohalosphaeraceae bacterium]HPO69513.1 HD-GYP domain-containing protein [Anaerohalosphaeraceae bacterium]
MTHNASSQALTDEKIYPFQSLADKLNRLDLNLLLYDAGGRCVLQSSAGRFESDTEAIAGQIESMQTAQNGLLLSGWPSDNLFVCPVSIEPGLTVFLAVDTGPAGCRNAVCEKRYLACIVEDFCKQFQDAERIPMQLEKIGTELSRAYEEIMLLYRLGANMKVTQTNASYLQMACDQLTQLVHVEGIVFFVEKKIDGRRQLALIAGSGVISIEPSQADILQTRLIAELQRGREALVDSAEDSPFRYDWPPAVRNIIAVPLGDADRMLGFMAATNILDKRDFDTTDIKLFGSVANQCRVFIENNSLFEELKELFIGCLKALTGSIDAKDQYTRGHSERVACISRWIAERLAQHRPLSDKQIHHIYLAGLLHDIGKIGIGESVLRKRGRLDDNEFAVIQSHPRIGASILSGIRQMDEIVPGVLGHHERMDGKGYPNGLKGDQIPLIAKIISLADAFDAMTSRRVYRDAMTIQKALSEIEKGIGTQFDEEVARAFLESDVDKLWTIIQDGFIESWDYSNFEEYGIEAVGALIR